MEFFHWPVQFLYQFVVQANSYGQMVISSLLFMLALPKRSHYCLRLLFSLTACVAAIAGSALLRTYQGSIYTRLVTHLFRIFMLFVISYICYDDTFQNRIRALCCGTAAREIGSAAYTFLLVLFGINQKLTISLFRPAGYATGWNTAPHDWIFYYGFHIAIYFLVYRFAHFQRYDKLDKQSFKEIIILSLYCLVTMVIPDVVRNGFGPSEIADMFVNRLYLLSFGVFVLFVLNSVDFQSKYRQEKAIMEQVLTDERKQYEQLKENMDIINVYCHDLRHQMNSLSGKLTKQELDALSQAMEFYDSNIKTGNEVLDVVLRTFQMRCRKEGIEFSCMADGSVLSFMATQHIFTLFNNALNNAIEAVQQIPLHEKRIISATVSKQHDYIVIQVVNFFSGVLPDAGKTSKAEKGQHGFGIKSMRYVAEAYQGSLTVQAKGDLYCLTVSIPAPLKCLD